MKSKQTQFRSLDQSNRRLHLRSRGPLQLTLGLSLCMAPTVACSSGSGTDTLNLDSYQSDLSRDTTVTLTAEETAAMARGSQKTAAALYNELVAEKPEENIVFSPYSLSGAFGMLYAGAKGDTATEIASALHYDELGDRIHAAMNRTDLDLQSRGEDAAGKDGADFALRVANAQWAQSGLEGISSDWLDTLATQYGSGMYAADFKNNPKEAADSINRWAAVKTNNKIDNVVDGQAVENWVIGLTNAVYFNAAWKSPFDPENTREVDFRTLDGKTARTDLMSQQGSFRYFEEVDYKAVELPYDDDNLAMVLVLPNEDEELADVEAQLGDAFINDLLDGFRTENVGLTMPTFSVTAKHKMTPALQSMGMSKVFTTGADLSGIQPNGNLFVSDVAQNAVIEVNESGTEAAAVTNIGMGVTSVPQVVPFHATRPFVYLIMDKPTGQVLFMGRVIDPTL